MAIEEQYIRLIFGLKLKQIRTDKQLSLFGLSKLTGLSKSYLNEIEKGKKYPKTDKIVILSEALDVPYDQLVSIKLDKNLAPIGEILQSKILQEIPLELFGIQESDLIDIIAEAPAKVNAFISTIIKIAQNYNLGRESFFLASLRSFQEANNNYFEDIEQKVEAFAKAYHIDLTQKITAQALEEILIEEYGYNINEEELQQYAEVTELRSIFVPSTKTLLLQSNMNEPQRTFIYAKEIAYNFMDITERPYTFSWIQFKQFDEVLNNFYASYFAGALILPRKKMVQDLKHLFSNKALQASAFDELLNGYNASPESVYQRMTNLLPKDFKLQDLFFLRFTHKVGEDDFSLVKELHITHQQSPHANETNEHYCRRWVSLATLKEVAQSKKAHVFGAQISQYLDHENEYLVLSSATADPFKEGHYRSISIGFLISSTLKKKVAFVNDKRIRKQQVGVTCETCGILDCDQRAAPPKRLVKKEHFEKTAAVVAKLSQEFS